MAIETKVVGLDVAKNVFQVHEVDRRGETVLRKRLRRKVDFDTGYGYGESRSWM